MGQISSLQEKADNKKTQATKKLVDFTSSQVDKFKERFELLCEDTKSADKTQFQQMLQLDTSTSNQLFDIFDSDKSGTVDFAEFITGLAMFSNSTLDDKAEILFNVYDAEQNHVLDKKELVGLMTDCINSLCSMSGRKSNPKTEEIAAATDKIFAQYETHKEDVIHKDEFKSVITKDPEILRVLIDHGIINPEEMRRDFGGKRTDGIPECDSDLEEEISKDHHDPKEYARAQRIKDGVDYKLDRDTAATNIVEEEHIEEGDEFMAVKPWVGTVKATVPSDYKPKKTDSQAPEAQLDLKYVFGYRCHDTRNNLRYNTQNEAVYHTAAVGIALDGKQNTQRFFIQHNDDITCLDICGDIVATGQMGRKPLLCIWNSKTMSLLTCIQGDLQHSLTNCCISPDGKYVAAIANDDDHTIGIYDLSNFTNPKYDKTKSKTDGSIITGKGPKAEILDMRFDPTGKQIVIACVKEVDFVSFEKGVIKIQKGSFPKGAPMQAIYCATWVGTTCITGAFDGSLYAWKGGSAEALKTTHKGPVNCLWTRRTGGFLSGGNDGQIVVWDKSLNVEDTIDCSKLNINSMQLKIRSVCDNGAGNILFGTRGGEVVELVGKKGSYQASVLMRGHFDEELWGLSVHPSKNQFYTVGQDKMIASWDIEKRKQIAVAKLDVKATCIAASRDEKYLAVGCMNGQVQIFDPKSLKLVNTIKERTKEISDLKFSPDSSLLAVGSQDSETHVYDVKKNFALKTRARGHHSRIKHIDFAEGGDFFQSTCTSYELLFFSAATGKRQNAPQFRDEKWSSWTTVIGWPVQGIWPECSKGSDIQAVDRHPAGNVLATADDFSMVKLFRYPCPIDRSAYNKYVGHSSHVTNVRFTTNGDWLLSTGGNDKAIFQWKYEFDHQGEEAANNIHNNAPEEAPVEDGNQIQQQDQDEGGDEAMATKPFKAQLEHSIPDKYSKGKGDLSAPSGNLTLAYCHGFRCFDAKNVVAYTSDPGTIVYAAAALGVTMDLKTKEQAYFNGHDKDVISLAIHPERKLVATGQMAHLGRAKQIDMFVWDIEKKTMLSRMNNFHLRAVVVIAFSPDGSKLVSYGQDDNNSLAVYDWAQGILLATAKVDQALVTASGWKSETEFFSCGVKHVKTWTLNGKNVAGTRANLSKELQTESFVSGAYGDPDGGVFVCGTGSGLVIPFNGGAGGKQQQAHKGAVEAIVAIPKKKMVVSGGADGKVIVWNCKGGLTKANEFSISGFTDYLPNVVSIDYKNDESCLLIGTAGGEIHELAGGKSTKYLQGHYSGELWGLACSPNKQRYVTCGGDSTVRLWEPKNPLQLAGTKPRTNDLRGIDWAPNGSFIVAGDMKGVIVVFDPDKLNELSTLQSHFNKKDQWIEDIKVSPDSKMIAFGAHGGCSPVEIMNVVDGKTLQKHKIIDPHMSSALLHVDWSSDGSSLVVNSQAYELMFLSLSTGKQIAASASKSIEYATWTCKLGWCVQGIFKTVNYADLHTVTRSHSQQVLVTGTNDQMVNLYRYPSLSETGTKFKSYIGHSSHVTRTRFTFDDSRVISTGGNDKAVLVWHTDFGGEHDEGTMTKEEVPDVSQIEDTGEFVKEKKKKGDKYKPESKAPDSNAGELFQSEEVQGGDEFMAVLPWLGAMKNPSDYKSPPVNQNQAPKAELTLEYVHGYRAKDCRNNVRYLKSGLVVYHAAALGIVLDQSDNTQKFFNLHIDDITSMSVHPNGVWVATGEIGPKPTVYVWDSNTMQAKFTLKGLEKGVCNLSFSPDGSKLVGCAVDDNHYIAVWDTVIGALICKDKGDVAPIVELKFKNETEFVSVGPKHYMYWTFSNKTIKSKRGQFGKYNDVLRCVAFNKDNVLTGASDGNLQVWNGNSPSSNVQLHTGPIDAIWIDKDYVMTGGADGCVNILDPSLKKLKKFQLGDFCKNMICAKVRSLCLSEDRSNLLVGTFGSEIFELKTSDKQIAEKTSFTEKDLMQGHFTPNAKWTNEVWGLALLSDGDTWATCSDDGTVRFWSTKDRKMTYIIDLNYDEKGQPLKPDPQTDDLSESAKGRSIAISSDDKFLAVGCKDGTLRVFEKVGPEWKMKKIFKDSKRWIQEVKFSPTGDQLASGDHERTIHFYSVPQFQLKGKVDKHHSYIKNFDWSKDGNSMHSTSGDYELLYWDCRNFKQITSGASEFKDKNEEWATWTCTLGWPVQGIWPPCSKGTDINYVDRSHGTTPGGYKLLALADDFSKVRLFRYPSLTKGSQSIEGRGHSSHVTNVKWGNNDEYLYSSGGEDNCVFQWKVSS